MSKKIFEMTSEEFDEFMNSEDGMKFAEDLVEAMDELDKEKMEQIEIIKTKEYMKWLIDFIDRCPNKVYNSEDFLYNGYLFTQEDRENEVLLDFFFDFLEEIDAITDCSDRFEEYRSYFYLNKRLYEYYLIIGQGSVVIIKDITEKASGEIFEKEITNLDKYFGENND